MRETNESWQKQATVSSVSVTVILPRLEFIYNQLCISLQLLSQRWSNSLKMPNPPLSAKSLKLLTKSEKASEMWTFEIVSVWNSPPKVKTVPSNSFLCQSRRLMFFYDVLAALTALMQTPGHPGSHLGYPVAVGASATLPGTMLCSCQQNRTSWNPSTCCLGFASDPNKADLRKSGAMS